MPQSEGRRTGEMEGLNRAKGKQPTPKGNTRAEGYKLKTSQGQTGPEDEGRQPDIVGDMVKLEGRLHAEPTNYFSRGMQARGCQVFPERLAIQTFVWNAPVLQCVPRRFQALGTVLFVKPGWQLYEALFFLTLLASQMFEIPVSVHCKLNWKVCKPFMWMQSCQQTTHLCPLLQVSLSFCKTRRLNEASWLYTFSWIMTGLAKLYFGPKIEKRQQCCFFHKNCSMKGKMLRLTDCHPLLPLWNVFLSIICYLLHNLILNRRTLIILHKPNSDSKHIHVPLCSFDEVWMCV